MKITYLNENLLLDGPNPTTNSKYRDNILIFKINNDICIIIRVSFIDLLIKALIYKTEVL